MLLAQKKLDPFALDLDVYDLWDFEVEADPACPAVGEFEFKVMVVGACSY